MRKNTLGVLTATSSMVGISILAVLHESNIIILSPFVSLPLILLSFIVTLFGLSKIFENMSIGEEWNKNFEKHWKEFMKWNYTERPPERVDNYELARMFYDFGFSRGSLQ